MLFLRPDVGESPKVNLVLTFNKLSSIHISNFLAMNPDLSDRLEIVMNELWRFKLSADFLENSSHIIESAIFSTSYVSNPLTHLHLKTIT